MEDVYYIVHGKLYNGLEPIEHKRAERRHRRDRRKCHQVGTCPNRRAVDRRRK